MLELKIPVKIANEMIGQAKDGAPLEICGILGGIDGRVEKLYAMTNTDASNEYYNMDPGEQFAAVKDMRAVGTKMVAIYHSHPESPARPSEEDIRLAFTNGVLHVVLSLQDSSKPEARAFNINDGVVSESELKIVEIDNDSK